VAEGVRTTHAACGLADLHGVEMPIAQSVKLLLDGKVGPKEGVELLLRRQLRSEIE
jgi:glycerol-3-phosphate dehydrogenase (NAD(P)+)